MCAYTRREVAILQASAENKYLCIIISTRTHRSCSVDFAVCVLTSGLRSLPCHSSSLEADRQSVTLRVALSRSVFILRASRPRMQAAEIRPHNITRKSRQRS